MKISYSFKHANKKELSPAKAAATESDILVHKSFPEYIGFIYNKEVLFYSEKEKYEVVCNIYYTEYCDIFPQKGVVVFTQDSLGS